MFNAIIEAGFIVGLVLAVVYAILSFMYYTYRYAKGDNHPGLMNPCRKDILKMINPFYYKHPMDIFLTATILVGIIGGLAIVWPVIIPVGIIYYTVNKIREKNLHKKKMWETLKGS